MGASTQQGLQNYQNYEQSPYANAFTFEQYNALNSGGLLGASVGSQTPASTSRAATPLVNTQYQGAGLGQLPGNMLPQTANWNNFYGPMSVPEMHFARLNRRFGWDPTGIGYGTYWNPQQPAYYGPTTQYPQGSFPGLTR